MARPSVGWQGVVGAVLVAVLCLASCTTPTSASVHLAWGHDPCEEDGDADAVTIVAVNATGGAPSARHDRVAPGGSNNATVVYDEQLYSDTFTRADLEVFKYTTLVCAGISACGSLFIIFNFCWMRSLQTKTYTLVLMLCVTDLMSSAAWLMNYDHGVADSVCPSAFCTISAMAMLYSEVAGMLWVFCIALNMYLVLHMHMKTQNMMLVYHVISWGIPSVFLATCVSERDFGDAGLWCWITEAHPEDRLGFYYVPLLVVTTAILVFFRLAWRAVSNSSQRKKFALRLQLYLAVFLACKLPLLINFAQSVLAPGKESRVLFFLQAMITPLQGLGNALAFGLNRKLLGQYRRRLQELGLMNKRKSTSDMLLSDCSEANLGGASGRLSQALMKPSGSGRHALCHPGEDNVAGI